jgi:hypothetical protein
MLLATAGGCRIFSHEELVAGRSPLQPAQPSPDSVAVEIIWARFPAGDPAMGDDSWREIDETQIEPSVRRELANNGLRAGVVGGAMPEAINRVLHQPVTDADDAAGKSIELATEPIVHGHKRRQRRGQRFEIQASEVYASIPLLVSKDNDLAGRTYQQAKAIYALRIDPRPDRTALIELTPELHYGAPKLRYTGAEDGVFRQAMLCDREVFERLQMSVRLAPGEMLVLMSMPDAGSRLGQYFHTVDSADGPQQKLILIRLAEVPPSDTFANLAD